MKRTAWLVPILVSAALCAPLAAQAPPPQNDVNKAIDKGCRYLMATMDRHLKDWDWWGHGNQTAAPLVLLTLVKSKVSHRHPAVQQLLAYSFKHDIERTYFASVFAIALETMEAEKYSGKIKQCAQFLVDNQCQNGQWGYGDPVPLPAPTRRRKGSGTDVKTPIKVHTPSKEKSGDNSNTQYAILGLRSCETAGFEVPKETWEKALKWWLSQQKDDGGWNYQEGSHDPSYLGMTEGGLGSVVICQHFLGQNWAQDKKVEKARKFLADHFSVSQNQILRNEDKDAFQYYHLYALERAGNLTSTETFGKHHWYAEGAHWLLKQQQKDGHWKHGGSFNNEVWDTCFAVLFLSRATAPMVATGTAKEHNKK